MHLKISGRRQCAASFSADVGDRFIEFIENQISIQLGIIKIHSTRFENIFVKREEQIDGCFDFFLLCLLHTRLLWIVWCR